MSFFAFAAGNTRWVALVGPLAFKVARLRMLYPLRRFIVLSYQGKAVERVKIAIGQHKSGNPAASLTDIFIKCGLRANLAEYRAYKEEPTALYVPTYLTLFGLVNVQPRGIPVREDEQIDDLLPAGFPRKACCWYQGRVRAFDYPLRKGEAGFKERQVSAAA